MKRIKKWSINALIMFLSMDKIEFGFTSWIVEIVNDCNLFPRIRLRARAKSMDETTND